MLKTTPFHARTAPLVLANAWRRWSGYSVASSYDWNADREYAAIRSAAALLDVSPLHKYLIEGMDAARLLDRMVTRSVQKMQIGQVIYTPWCDGEGKVIDDGTVTRLDDQRFRLTSGEPGLAWLRQNAFGLSVSISEVTESLAALALQGPLSRDVLNSVCAAPLDGLRYFRMAPNAIAEVGIEISRTGYTGDLGYEIWMPAAQALPIWDALMRAGQDYGVVPAGIWALDVARIEAGLIMLDVDYHSSHRAMIDAQKSSPYELSLDWAVQLDKGPFNGRRALRAELARGVAWRFVGIEVEWDSLEALYAPYDLQPSLPMIPWRTSTPLYRSGRQIGYASSGCWSALLKRYIAVGHVHAGEAGPDTAVEMEITVEHQRQRAASRIRKLPFFDPPRKRA